MSWKDVTIMSQRFEFVMLSLQEGANISELCRRFNISRPTGYKFLHRYKEEGSEGLHDRSKRPLHSPKITNRRIEQTILALRDEHSAWGGRKLKTTTRRYRTYGYTFSKYDYRDP